MQPRSVGCVTLPILSLLLLLVASGHALTDQEVRNQVQTVHVIFMTHLDLGFTDFEHNVEDLYFDRWFPNAIAVADALRQRGGEERFMWTTHPWLLTEYLRNGTAAQVAAVEAAIARGDIQWQAGPFNLQTENMDASLFDYAMSLSAQLDAQFNATTKIGASQKDVPGATRGIVPLMHQRGIKWFHVGANDASTPPAVPSVSPNGLVCNTFVWQDNASSTDLMCSWCNGYSHTPWGITPEMQVLVPGFSDALVFLMMVDNTGPQNVTQVLQGWANVRAQFPNATIVASSLETFAARLETVKHTLPVYSGEIGDSWIYGAPSDPKKMRIFRELSRQRAAALAANASLLADPAFREFSRVLAKLPEHTWGLANTVEGNNDWTNAQFRRIASSEAAKKNELSWNEQRAFNVRAIIALDPLPQMQFDFIAAVAATFPSAPALAGYAPLHLREGQLFTTPTLAFAFNPNTGAMNYLITLSDRRVWASAENPMAFFHYTTFSGAHMLKFQAEYNMCPPYCNVPDFGKPNMPTKHTQQWSPSVVGAWNASSSEALSFVFNLSMPVEAHTLYGAPAVVYINYTIPLTTSVPTVLIDVQWFNKTATRLAEATWLSFVPLVNDTNGWSLDKLGSSISPSDVCVNGSRALHAVWTGVSWSDSSATLKITSLDAPVVAPGKATLLEFDNKLPDLTGGMHFNLHNNLWNTNYPVWYSNDERFRFEITMQ